MTDALTKASVVGVLALAAAGCGSSNLGVSIITYKGNSQWQYTSSGQYYAGTGWHFIAAVIDGTRHSQTLYVDGAQKAQTNYPEPIVWADDTGGSQIGANGSFSQFAGKVADVRIYGSAFAAADIKEMYAEGASKHGLAVR